ncbi:hypothetical protein F5884DRAFT_327912 [Xylogone sp. PMI_703]|nr:hypothetical protein F5884DRAFT_327912 [Xylogone sp. PMI_703]
MEYNMEPERRQFRALESLSKLERGWVRDLLAGHNYDVYEESFLLVDKIRDLTLQELEALRNILDSKRMNFLQWRAFDLFLFSSKAASCLQGPPGTGKSHVISLLTVIANILGIPVLVCGPSRASVKALSVKIVGLIEELKSTHPLIAPKLRLTILPTKKESQKMALADLQQIDASALDDEDRASGSYQWFRRAIEYGETKFNKGPEGVNDAYWRKMTDWHCNLQHMRAGQVLSLHD